ncbi:MAG: hypothetical protein ACE5JS_20265 [Nitrospinota bacterium]
MTQPMLSLAFIFAHNHGLSHDGRAVKQLTRQLQVQDIATVNRSKGGGNFLSFELQREVVVAVGPLVGALGFFIPWVNA